MHCEKAYLVINPRAGQDMTKLTDVFTILSAAGWDVDNALVEYGGHARELAAKAAKHEYDVIIGHGGDGTTNELVNAVRWRFHDLMTIHFLLMHLTTTRNALPRYL